MTPGSPITEAEIRYAAEQHELHGRSFKDIAHELKRDATSLRNRTWYYLKKRDYKL